MAAARRCVLTPSPRQCASTLPCRPTARSMRGVHLRDHATGAPRIHDGEKGDSANVSNGKAARLQKAGASRRKRPRRRGAGAGTFTATVAFRAADDLSSLGPRLPAAHARAHPAPACGAPMLEPVSDTEMRVHFAVPHGQFCIASVEFYEDASRSETIRRPRTRAR